MYVVVCIDYVEKIYRHDVAEMCDRGLLKTKWTDYRERFAPSIGQKALLLVKFLIVVIVAVVVSAAPSSSVLQRQRHAKQQDASPSRRTRATAARLVCLRNT